MTEQSPSDSEFLSTGSTSEEETNIFEDTIVKDNRSPQERYKELLTLYATSPTSNTRDIASKTRKQWNQENN